MKSAIAIMVASALGAAAVSAATTAAVYRPPSPVVAATGVVRPTFSAPVTRFNDRPTTKVIKIIDANLLEVDASGSTMTLRLLGVRSASGDRDDECRQREALSHLSGLVKEGDLVSLESDAIVVDSEGRFPRYVYLASGQLLNEVMAKDGYAVAVASAPALMYQQRLSQATETARAASAGLWAGCPARPTAADGKPSSTPQAKEQLSAIATMNPTRSTGATISANQTLSASLSALVRLTTPAGQGSGMILTADGVILTCSHVVEGASGVDVQLADGRILAGVVVARDAGTDLAIVKVDGSGLPTVKLGQSNSLKIGDDLFVVGYPGTILDHGSGPPIVTRGVFSAFRPQADPLPAMLQTDATAHPGNSGGPVVNAKGEVVGVLQGGLKDSRGEILSGSNLAVAISEAMPIIERLSGRSLSVPTKTGTPTATSGRRT